MLKLLQWMAFLSIASTVVGSEAALGLPVDKESLTKEVFIQFSGEIPLCYMQTADGRALDLTNLCTEKPGDPNLSAVRPAPQPYNTSNIKKFDEELYGEDN